MSDPSSYSSTSIPPSWGNRVVTTRSYPMECVSCYGSGYSQRVVPGTTTYESCKGCGGIGKVWVQETVTSPVIPYHI